MIRFGKWKEILVEPDYPDYRLASRAVRRYASVPSPALLLGERTRLGEKWAAFREAMGKGAQGIG